MRLSAPVDEPLVLDVLGATGGLEMPEANLTGVEAHSLEGRLNVSRRTEGVYFVWNSTRPSLGWYGLGASCLALAEDVNSSMEPAYWAWAPAAAQGITGTGCSYFRDAVLANAREADWWANSVRDSSSFGSVVSTTVEPVVHATELVDVVQQVREQTRLPVNDLSAMLGIKRRQFYNWLDGRLPSNDRIRRLFALRDAVARLADAAEGDARRVRVALLAPISGDSVYHAFIEDDSERIDRAVDAAETAISEGHRFTRRVPGSARARSAAGAADELRFERDSPGLYTDSENDDES